MLIMLLALKFTGETISGIRESPPACQLPANGKSEMLENRVAVTSSPGPQHVPKRRPRNSRTHIICERHAVMLIIAPLGNRL